MEYNEALLNALIYETNLKQSNGTFEWITEWLGYLPFGQYLWLEINNHDISNNFQFSWDFKDLLKLTNLGLITIISTVSFGDDKKIIKYKINPPESY